ncbi:MAG: glycosyltransferase family 2 protein [Candidatus Woesearchaeota archaeon]
MLTIVIPVRNESATIAEVIKRIKKNVKQRHEIIVVDDASTDDTSKIAKKLGAKVIHHNLPQGGVVGDDFKNFKGEFVVSLDADLEHDPADIPKFVEALKGCDLVLGERNYRSRIMEYIIEIFYPFPARDFFTGYVGLRRKWIPFFVQHKIRLVWEAHFAVWAAGGKICNVSVACRRSPRPSRFGGSLKGNAKTWIFFNRYRIHARHIRANSCHRIKNSKAPLPG